MCYVFLPLWLYFSHMLQSQYASSYEFTIELFVVKMNSYFINKLGYLLHNEIQMSPFFGASL